jgi:hypothetical protein
MQGRMAVIRLTAPHSQPAIMIVTARGHSGNRMALYFSRRIMV